MNGWMDGVLVVVDKNDDDDDDAIEMEHMPFFNEKVTTTTYTPILFTEKKSKKNLYIKFRFLYLLIQHSFISSTFTCVIHTHSF